MVIFGHNNKNNRIITVNQISLNFLRVLCASGKSNASAYESSLMNYINLETNLFCGSKTKIADGDLRIVFVKYSQKC